MGVLKAVAVISGNTNVKGSLQFVQDSSGVTHVKGRITGLTPGLHGFHIHALGDTTNGCNSTERHAGDLGNIVAGPDGVAEISIRDSQIPLSGQHSILGRAVVVHADPDDLGRDSSTNYMITGATGGHELSKTTGNAGARVGCEVTRVLQMKAPNHKQSRKEIGNYYLFLVVNY
ncbi:hypothetical protein Cgig2_012205 [Carnegiea gigantea]|uniref:superoxide dismutase n=1 Tax=Carnegiea gigantea TaxID=171969 RepID=A0A9Q1QP30_9CARY|nr:hypothetical protein Cgig2_012205 [Carnegiea gigantea]